MKRFPFGSAAVASLLFLLACGSGASPQSGQAVVATPGAPGQDRTAMERLLASEPRLAGASLGAFLEAAYGQPGLGPALWRSSLAASGTQDLPTLDGLIKTLAQPLTRPLLMEAIERDLQATSDRRKREAKANPASQHYNVVVVGAGPNGAVAALNLKAASPHLRVALVDSAALPGEVFHTFGAFCWINSPELPAYSSNAFTGLAVAVKDLLGPGRVASGPHFILPFLLGDLTELAVLASGADCWLGTEVGRIRKRNGLPGFRVSTNQPGVSFTADQVLLTTGLGRRPYYGLPAHSAPAEPRSPMGMEDQEHFDHLAARASRRVFENRLLPAGGRRSFMEPYVGKRVAVVGAGDSANNLVEFLLGYGWPEVYGLPGASQHQPGTLFGPGVGEPGGPASVLWINQKYLTKEAFLKGNKPRYLKTLPDNLGRLELRPERLVDVQPRAGGGFTLFLHGDEHAPILQEQADYVWFGTGYKVTSSPAIASLTKHKSGRALNEDEMGAFLSGQEAVRERIQVTVPGPFAGQWVEAVVGRRISTPGPTAGIFLGGAVAGALATPQELKDYSLTQNPASINVNSPRASALGRHLATLPGYAALPVASEAALPLVDLLPTVRGGQLRTLRSQPLGSALPQRSVLEYPADLDPGQRKAYLEMALKARIVWALRGFSVTADYHVRLTVEGAEQPQKAMAYLSFPMPQETLGTRAFERVNKDATLLRLAMAYARESGALLGKFQLGIQIKGSKGPLVPIRARHLDLRVH